MSTTTLLVGEEVAVLLNSRSWGDCRFQFSIVKTISKSGIISLENGRRFNKDGEELKSKVTSFPSCYLFPAEEARERIAKQDAYNAKQKRIHEVVDFLKGRMSSGNYFIDDEQKTQLIKLVEAI